ncbi:Sac2 family-domain-containing protein [Myxozyma melibiosi]|uniref:Sac2 family-domain-containing protein n=1 Tax=Myxozyma melibiosi TaxID=54550 RepID=A0ABR1F1G7_9ASCO
MQIWNSTRRTQRQPAGAARSGTGTPQPPPSSAAQQQQQPTLLQQQQRASLLQRSPLPQTPTRPAPSTATPQPSPSPEKGSVKRSDVKVDPLAVLGRILDSDSSYIKAKVESKSPGSKPRSKSESEPADVSVLIRKIDGDALARFIKSDTSAEDQDIAAYLETLEKQSKSTPSESTDSSEQEKQNIAAEYEQQIERFKDLHVSIQKCDSVLASVGDYLSLFEKDLGLLSSEIETLQNRSIFLNRRLENRREVETRLAALIDDILIPPFAIKKILTGEINTQWISLIQILWTRLKRMELFKAEAQKISQSVALIDEIEPVLKMLADKAVERIRDFFVAKIKSLRVINTNAQVIQYSIFLKFRQLFAFLAYVNPQLCEDIIQGYINTMRWYYSSDFTRYVKALEKLKIRSIDRSSLIGAEGSKKILSSSRAQYTSSQRDPLTLGRRVNIIFSTDSSVMMENSAEQSQDVLWMEIGFRSFNLALMDNVCAEYLFIVDFFAFKSPEQQAHIFQEIFKPTFRIGEDYVKKLLELSHMDAFGILLCIRIIQLLEFELQRRKVPVMEGYCHAINMVLWPRFQHIMNAHSDNLRMLSGKPPADAGTSGLGRSASNAISGLSAMLSSTHVSSALPHPVTQKFATFLNGILELCPEDMESEPVSVSVVRLRNEFEAFLTKFSSKITAPQTAASGNSRGGADAKETAKLRERFLYNNYMVVCTVISDAEGTLADQEREHFRKLAEAYGASAT